TDPDGPNPGFCRLIHPGDVKKSKIMRDRGLSPETSPRWGASPGKGKGTPPDRPGATGGTIGPSAPIDRSRAGSQPAGGLGPGRPGAPGRGPTGWFPPRAGTR